MYGHNIDLQSMFLKGSVVPCFCVYSIDVDIIDSVTKLVIIIHNFIILKSLFNNFSIVSVIKSVVFDYKLLVLYTTLNIFHILITFKYSSDCTIT